MAQSFYWAQHSLCSVFTASSSSSSFVFILYAVAIGGAAIIVGALRTYIAILLSESVESGSERR